MDSPANGRLDSPDPDGHTSHRHRQGQAQAVHLPSELAGVPGRRKFAFGRRSRPLGDCVDDVSLGDQNSRPVGVLVVVDDQRRRAHASSDMRPQPAAHSVPPFSAGRTTSATARCSQRRTGQTIESRPHSGQAEFRRWSPSELAHEPERAQAAMKQFLHRTLARDDQIMHDWMAAATVRPRMADTDGVALAPMEPRPLLNAGRRLHGDSDGFVSPDQGGRQPDGGRQHATFTW